ncbi:bifunctional [glutamate--ammonia ligase]-adenylyl-L-tyrosine phosphorylase/[glutamate--ammonia-ligase] adenylyltransferase [Kaarinaea lacus]
MNSAPVIEAPLATVPPVLQDAVRHHWDRFVQAVDERGLSIPGEADFIAGLCRVWACSEYAAQLCTRQPALLLGLQESGDLSRVYEPGTFGDALNRSLADVESAEQLATRLRQHRQREMLRICWRDIGGHADLDETMADLSALADASIQAALTWHYQQLVEGFGEPRNEAGETQQMVVLGMGKLGARELNFSSDVDLIFTFPEAGQTHGGRKSLANEQFFTRLGQALIKALDDNTADGFVFRVDMRLRPFGQSGALACSFQAMENYYQVHGRDWERYAFIKARVVAGDQQQGADLLKSLRPFVYRRYLDYGAFEALRAMKEMVDAEVKRKGMANHVKLGPGGIREVEFIGQTFQLIRGGRVPELQRREIQYILSLLGERGYLPEYVVQQLQAAYVFLRTTEHRLQEYQDRQTHRLPEDEIDQQRLAYSMGFAHWDDFIPVLRGHMARVHSRFEQVFAAPQTDHGEEAKTGLSSLWIQSPGEAEAIAVLSGHGYRDAAGSWSRLCALKQGYGYQALTRSGRDRLDKLVPLVLGAVAHASDPDKVLRHLVTLLETIARRSAYLSLLIEHPVALSQLVRLVDASPWITQLLTQHPLLLDELLDPRSLYAPPGRAQVEADLDQRLSGIDREDLEQAMDALRQFKQANVLRVAAADVVKAVPLMVVSDKLTDIAEVILGAVLDQAWQDMVGRHGYPSCANVGEGKGDDEKGFAVIAYGKLGGIELGYGSDLDLVFVHNSDNTSAMSSGAKPVADEVFFARLGQRMIHILTARTPAGILYEVDMRLRPSGASGLLVVSLSAFEDYQKNKAWTWEHQALVRARVVAGDRRVGEGFEQVRRDVMALERDPVLLKKDIVEMREKMRESLIKAKKDEYDLKQGLGGIADIEFMVQYGVLHWTHRYPSLVDFTDNIRLLEGFARHGIMSEHDAEILSDAYRAYRAEVHRLTLQEQPAIVSDDQFAKQRYEVVRLWRKMFEGDNGSGEND